MSRRTRLVISISLFSIWLIFTISLTVWWFIFGLRQLNRIVELAHLAGSELLRYQRMLMWEGATLITSLMLGGAALAYYMVREMQQREALQRFFATFTHELKTPIASLRLQSEILREEVQDEKQRRLLDRLVGDTARLTLQLENSLFLADERHRLLLRESIDLREMVRSLEGNWPGLEIVCPPECLVRADRRALLSIVQNVIQNSVTHGKASRVSFELNEQSGENLFIRISDNGQGFAGDYGELGKPYRRFYSGSGSGVGVYLSKKLAREMGGALELVPSSSGFQMLLKLPRG